MAVGVMDKRYHKWHILGLIISAVVADAAHQPLPDDAPDG